MSVALRALNLALLIAFPLVWAAPILRAGLLPLFGLSSISVYSGVASLARSDPALAALVALLAMVLPYAKVVGLALVQFGRLPARLLPALRLVGKFAMADVFLVALYIVVAKGVAVGRVETAWGLWAYTACVLLSLVLALLTRDG